MTSVPADKPLESPMPLVAVLEAAVSGSHLQPLTPAANDPEHDATDQEAAGSEPAPMSLGLRGAVISPRLLVELHDKMQEREQKACA